jgi:hypothetical protein
VVHKDQCPPDRSVMFDLAALSRRVDDLARRLSADLPDLQHHFADLVARSRGLHGEERLFFRINGKDAGGLYSADASAANALKLGAKQLMVPFDIPDVGRVAILQDPTGAAISMASC